MRMEECAGIGIYIDVARFVPANTFFKDCSITRERTVNCYELVLFLKDGGYCVINGKKYPIKSGSVRFHRPGDKVYSYRFNEIYVIHFHVDQEEKGERIFGDIPSFITFPQIEEEIMLVKGLITAWVEKNDFECMYVLWRLLGTMKSQFRIQQKNSKAHVASRIKQYINDNYAKQLTLEELSRTFYMHPVYLQRKFKEETGMTPAEYHKKVRLAKARVYLLTTDLAVSDISERCGFCNTSYFIDVFKKNENVTPLQFKQRTDSQILYL